MDRVPELPMLAPASVAFTVNVYVPATVGVPEITPAADRDVPVGSDPVRSAQVYGAAPPVTVRAWEYAAPRTALGRDVVVTTTVVPAACGARLSTQAASSARMPVWSSPLTPGTCNQFGPFRLFSNQQIGAFCLLAVSRAVNTSRTCPVDPPVWDQAVTSDHAGVLEPPDRPHSPMPRGMGVFDAAL